MVETWKSWECSIMMFPLMLFVQSNLLHCLLATLADSLLLGLHAVHNATLTCLNIWTMLFNVGITLRGKIGKCCYSVLK